MTATPGGRPARFLCVSALIFAVPFSSISLAHVLRTRSRVQGEGKDTSVIVRDLQNCKVNIANLASNKQHFMLIAAEEASKSILREKHGCVIVRGGEIISRGYNKHAVKVPKKLKGNLSRHAERDAIQNCRKKIDMRDADLYVVRWGNSVVGNPEFMYSAPCAACVSLIRACMKK
uniref:CMP/dCMP-type deaminase domain-containing protein n=1 Tax=Amorphochlora amoebiformis TaxID=1561963 RepID=A0A7S0DFU3_9EUKA|mmetsp:Transcript_26162/g.41388  ORF Transcript_26162/g.41388 Transcript_26162/m.41388 type:complete len:175 (+) Transcript_26162:26-550(+)